MPIAKHPRTLITAGAAAFLLLCAYSTTAFGAQPSVDIQGANNELTENIRHHIGELSPRELQQSRALHKKLEAAITEASQALGYYGTHFDYHLNEDRLRINVTPGAAVRWAEADISLDAAAATVPAIQDFLNRPTFVSGQRIRHRQYERFKNDLLEQVQEYGFIDAEYRQSRLRIDLDQRIATPVLDLVSGPRYRVRTLSFSGSRLDDGLLQRMSPLQPGDYLQRSQVTGLQRHLQNSLYFSEVSVKSRPLPSDEVDIDIALQDAPKHQFAVGLGFGTDTGPRARLRWDQPQFNRLGHRLTSEAKVSEPLRELSSVYRIPLDKPIQRTANLNLGWTEKRLEDTASTVGLFGASITDRDWSNWIVEYGSTLEWETYRQGSQPRQYVAYVVPAVSLLRVELPVGVDPLHGYKTAFSFQGSATELGADTAFLRVSALHKRLFHLGGSHLLIARGEVGAIATDNILEVPASKRFFTGGDQTVRGFDYESLGPRDANGELIGGKFLNVASLEYSLRFAQSWRAAVFTDAGRAFNDESAAWRQSAGVGVRWLSPFGKVRIDLAVPVNDENDGFRLHIFMGPSL